MGHNHHHHSHGNSTGNIAVAFFLNLAFTIIEFIGGFYTNSLAIMSDALHDLGDSLSLGLSWYFQKKSTKKANKKYSYGYKRFSLLGAIINSIVLVIGSVFIIKEAIPRVINPESADAKGMMWLAVLGIIVNGAAVLKLKKGTSINERVVSLHLLEDVLGWGVVLIASIVMQFWNIPVLDPVLSIAIAGFVLYNVYKNIKESIRIILQGTPENISVEEIQQRIVSMKDVEGIHDCHLWTMDGEYNVFTAHLVLKDKEISWEKWYKMKQEIKQVLHDDFHLEHITLELEFTSQECDYENCGS
ncbi:cobalt-zinc-cadmium efflux system protein [Tenacibaculum mesophilum]|uniref:Cation transporter n=1 Tax=Tenacibaculum mesophilum TaxID=104268 RepID=A0ABM7CEQ0_9FLAO|nr:cation diffusion facilitator family transporter [Tenacibaculum mesophilum]AZJ32226.1 cation transporter [Tenacibaculum mesophilum]QFS27482.1 cation diffusion facilitator family transporter [Tenacibaculum mesophilum]SHG17207.1 cobalt-zinc-cadmium efflux system protein [Tenacibaculum mesophilum]